MTVLELLKRTSEYLQKHGIESPRLNIEHLTARVLGCGRMELYLQFDRVLYEDELAKLRELVKRRVAGEPLQHLLGDVEFLGQTFLCDARALVPRPETELLVETLLRRYAPPDALKGAFKPMAAPATAPPEDAPTQFLPAVRLLDIATGSGVIALSLAKHWPGAEVTATDISPAALAMARENAEKLGLAAKVRFLEGDLLAALPPGEPPFRGMVANLPYIPTGELPELQREVQFDPAQALDGGEDGLELVRRLITQSPAHLEAGGWLALEIGHDQGETVKQLALEAGFARAEVVPDYNGIGRFVIAELA